MLGLKVAQFKFGGVKSISIFLVSVVFVFPKISSAVA